MEQPDLKRKPKGTKREPKDTKCEPEDPKAAAEGQVPQKVLNGISLWGFK